MVLSQGAARMLLPVCVFPLTRRYRCFGLLGRGYGHVTVPAGDSTPQSASFGRVAIMTARPNPVAAAAAIPMIFHFAILLTPEGLVGP